MSIESGFPQSQNEEPTKEKSLSASSRLLKKLPYVATVAGMLFSQGVSGQEKTVEYTDKSQFLKAKQAYDDSALIAKKSLDRRALFNTLKEQGSENYAQIWQDAMDKDSMDKTFLDAGHRLTKLNNEIPTPIDEQYKVVGGNPFRRLAGIWFGNWVKDQYKMAKSGVFQMPTQKPVFKEPVKEESKIQPKQDPVEIFKKPVEPKPTQQVFETKDPIKNISQYTKIINGQKVPITKEEYDSIMRVGQTMAKDTIARYDKNKYKVVPKAGTK
jgi:hypothetical protein